jgi:hypothetical protein
LINIGHYKSELNSAIENPNLRIADGQFSNPNKHHTSNCPSCPIHKALNSHPQLTNRIRKSQIATSLIETNSIKPILHYQPSRSIYETHNPHPQLPSQIRESHITNRQKAEIEKITALLG